VFLANPSLPIEISENEAKKTVIEKTQERGETTVLEAQLVLTPFYLIHFDIFAENEVHGVTALNAVTRSFNSELGAEIEKYAESGSMSNETSETNAVIKKTILEKHLVEEIAKAKLAVENNVKKEEILLSSVQPVFFPEWHLAIEIEGNKIDVAVNAVSGDVLGLEKIPEKEKGYAELARETLNELKNPNKWFDYSAEIAKIASEKSASGKNTNLLERVRTDFRLQILVLVIILLIILFVR